MGSDTATIETVLRSRRDALLESWLSEQLGATGVRSDLISESELRTESTRFIDGLITAVEADSASADISASEWSPVREQLTDLSRSRATQGFTPAETAQFVFSFKQALFEELQSHAGDDGKSLSDLLWAATRLLDALGLYTVETFIYTRESVIKRQQDELIELSTPVVKLWDGVVALPLIGTLDSARTQVVMESLLEKIVSTGAGIAVIDITGVPTVDTLVAQHLLKTVAAARLMGAECIISGIRPQIAQTIVHLGVELQGVVTKATLADAFAVALERSGLAVKSA